MNKLMIFTLMILVFAACGPTIHYLGDSYTVNEKIDVYYDENDVHQPYKVIGKMTHDKIVNYDLDDIKNEMIKKAKQKGADGIIFDDFSLNREVVGEGDRFSVTANAIRYENSK